MALESPRALDARVTDDMLTAARTLRDGGIVAIPTDTVYGLAASIFQPGAIDRIFRVKQRAPDAAVPVLLATAADLHMLVREVPRIAWTLIDRFWPGSLTLVLPAKETVSVSITRGGRTVAVRVPAGRSTLELLQSLGEPVVGTSANRHGQPAALTYRDVQRQLGSEIDAVLVDDSIVGSGPASTVVEITDDVCLIHREGAIAVAEIRMALGPTLPVQF